MDDSTAGKLIANIENLAGDIGEMKAYLSKSSDRHVDVMSKLAVIESKQVDNAAYQRECDAARANHTARISTLEHQQVFVIRTAKAMISFMGACFVGVVTAIAEVKWGK